MNQLVAVPAFTGELTADDEDGRLSTSATFFDIDGFK